MALSSGDKESDSEMPLMKMEFALNMNCESCADLVRSKLENIPGVYKVHINVSDDCVVVDTVLKTSEVQALLETTGFLVFFKGFGGAEEEAVVSDRAAAVAILKGKGSLIGLVRMVQASAGTCVIEAALDKVPSGGRYLLSIHQLGDVSLGGLSCGEVYGMPSDVPKGYLGIIKADESCTASLHTVSKDLNVSDIIGRSVVVTSQADNTRVMWGVIARSAGLFQNSKKLCTCDGVTIWDEAKKKFNSNVY